MESDEELYRRTRAGDLAAFDVLYARYERPLYGFLLAQLRQRQDAEEAFHEAFLKALEVRDQDLDTGGFRPWLYRIARNVALNRLRTKNRAERAAAELPELDAVELPHRALEDRQRRRALAGAVERLPPALSELYRLRVTGLSYEEMAAVLEIPLGTLKSRMHQMVTTLREELGSWTAH